MDTESLGCCNVPGNKLPAGRSSLGQEGGNKTEQPGWAPQISGLGWDSKAFLKDPVGVDVPTLVQVGHSALEAELCPSRLILGLAVVSVSCKDRQGCVLRKQRAIFTPSLFSL